MKIRIKGNERMKKQRKIKPKEDECHKEKRKEKKRGLGKCQTEEG